MEVLLTRPSAKENMKEAQLTQTQTTRTQHQNIVSTKLRRLQVNFKLSMSRNENYDLNKYTYNLITEKILKYFINRLC